MEVPLTINEDVPVDADEPPEKRSREEETVGEGMILPFSLSISFHGVSPCSDLLLVSAFLFSFF